MSEYQHVAFRAIDRPVGKRDLEYMHRQSTRAEITPWAFANDYHYGDFRGNVPEMLRRGYDLHLHYADYGIRTVWIRLPQGLPDADAAQAYFVEEFFRFERDKAGRGGCLRIEPYFEPGHLEDDFDPAEVIEELMPIRDEVLNGDLRPLYLAHLAIRFDDQHELESTTSAPIPAGLKKLTAAQKSLANFLGLSESLLTAAAAESPPLVPEARPTIDAAAWLQRLPVATKDAWLAAWLADPSAPARLEMLTEFRQAAQFTVWPTVRCDRTIAQIQTAAEAIEQRKKTAEHAKTAKRKADRQAEMVRNPKQTLQKLRELVAARSTTSYMEVADKLTELREALEGTDQAELAESFAQTLKAENPKLHFFTAELRRSGFVPKVKASTKKTMRPQ